MIITKEKATIDYDKYANMDTRQLANALTNAKKTRAKIPCRISSKNQKYAKVVRFLKSKIKESVDRPQFVNYKKSGLPELAREIEKQFTPQELEQIRREFKQDMMRSDDEP